jgi:hypothetical protein
VHTLVHDEGTAARLRETFATHRADSKLVEAQSWAARSWTLRVKEGASRLVSPLL